MMTDTNYAKRLKAQFKKRLEEIDSRIRVINYGLAMPSLSISKSAKDEREHLRRGRKQLNHERNEILKDIREKWREYKGGKK